MTKPPATGAELEACLDRLELSQVGAAKVVGVDDRTMRRWIAEERPIPEPVRRLLWLLERHPELLGELWKHVGAAP